MTLLINNKTAAYIWFQIEKVYKTLRKDNIPSLYIYKDIIKIEMYHSSKGIEISTCANKNHIRKKSNE